MSLVLSGSWRDVNRPPAGSRAPGVGSASFGTGGWMDNRVSWDEYFMNVCARRRHARPATANTMGAVCVHDKTISTERAWLHPANCTAPRRGT